MLIGEMNYHLSLKSITTPNTTRKITPIEASLEVNGKEI